MAQTETKRGLSDEWGVADGNGWGCVSGLGGIRISGGVCGLVKLGGGEGHVRQGDVALYEQWCWNSRVNVVAGDKGGAVVGGDGHSRANAKGEDDLKNKLKIILKNI